jgi:hypothetical protein
VVGLNRPKLFITGAALGVVASAAVSQQLLYEMLVIPRLSHVSAVPLLWWLIVAAPIVVVALAVGRKAGSWPESLAVAALGAVGLQAYLHWAAASGRPGLHKSLAVEASLYHWTAGVLTMFLLLSVPIVLARATHAQMRPRAGGTDESA